MLLYHLIRNHDNAYWRPEGKGYTEKVGEAGRFMAYYARAMVESSYGEVRMEEVKDTPVPFVARNIVGLISSLIDAKEAKRALDNNPRSFFESRQEADNNVFKIENDLCAALKEVMRIVK